ncbi:MAG: CidA/LrgA family protein [Oscillospiraceae bacterium]
MKILLQVALVFGIYRVSQGIEAILPVAFPASVISLLLLLVLLLTGIVKVDHVREKSDFLLGNLGFFFIPVSVSIINYVDLIWQNAAAFLTVCVVSMVLTYGATAWAVHLTRRLMERGGKRK